ncbi:nucleic acid binding protein [Panicum miliaceum]|uniref:Nucleic acid binding protein n=1 Tax=Panicum miliaceum TaxID=4540 RepID=A0A3L6PTB5_PANMI|nr:nucleic acid binding protein [Panicum miliaceum]
MARQPHPIIPCAHTTYRGRFLPPLTSRDFSPLRLGADASYAHLLRRWPEAPSNKGVDGLRLMRPSPSPVARGSCSRVLRRARRSCTGGLLLLPASNLFVKQFAPPASVTPPSAGSGGNGAEDNRMIWVGDLQYWMDENYLHSCFGPSGEVRSFSLPEPAPPPTRPYPYRNSRIQLGLPHG